MHTTYSLPLVLISLLTAIGASYIALDLTGRTVAARGRLRSYWLAGGAFNMGTGIWAMHYIGMLALRVEVPVRYDVPTVLLSLIAAIAASLVAFLLVTQERLGWMRAVLGSLVMGGGIATMHYVGMAAMHVSATTTWEWPIVLASIVLAVAVSFVALVLTFRLRTETRQFAPRKLFAALVMGLAVASMHYTGMAAARWTVDRSILLPSGAIEITTLGIAGIIAVTFLIFAFAVTLSIVDRQLSVRAFALRAFALRESERRYRLLFQRSLTGHFRSTRDGRLLECNEAFAQIFGYDSVEQCIARVMQEAHASPTERAGFLQQLDVKGAVVQVERELRRQDGTKVWILEHATLLREVERGVEVIEGTIIDITERKRTGEALAQAAAAAESANRAKSDFLANMSHEIRTPMNGILGMTDVVLRTELSVQARDAIGVIQRSAEALMDIINDILDFSKIEAGKLELDPVEFDLRAVIDDAIRALAPRAHAKDLELTVNLASGFPRRVVADGGRIRQILLNLLGNAVKFTERGEVAVRAETETAADGAVTLHLSIRDTGIGIPKEKQEAVFAAFTQADASTTRRYGGTGLGLAITSHLVELMRGRIRVESEPGVGSTFHVHLPIVVGDEAASAPAPSGLVDLRGTSVLVVDDNATNRRILEDTLVHWGLRPTLVDSGRAAIDALRQAQATGRPFGLVLLDVQMPDMDGFDVAQEIAKRPEIQGVTIMMLSSVGEQADSARLRSAGIHAFLTKPVRPSLLLDSILALGVRAHATGPPVARPAAQPAAPPVAQPVAQPNPRAGGRCFSVLLAEDNPVNQLVARAILAAGGHSVAVAGTGREAVELSSRTPFDLILMDVQMPEMDGREATAAIRAREATEGGHVPIIALTASAMEVDRTDALAAGMDGFLTKPIRYDEFLEQVERAVPPGTSLRERGART